MRISSLNIQNFRSIRSVEIDFEPTTVFIGPNNAGKSAILDALRIALTRRWGQRGTGFTEYDVHLESDSSDPKTAPAIVIELRVEESVAGEWPVEIHQALAKLIHDDPHTGRAGIALRVTCEWNAAESIYQPIWHFLTSARTPLPGESGRQTNLERFWQFLPTFYLGALRDADDEFSPRGSQFWARLLKAMEVPTSLEDDITTVLDDLNRRLVSADPRMAQIAKTVADAAQVACRDGDGSFELRALPLKPWDLLSRASLIVRNEPKHPWLPLKSQGQGLQSLSVIFLFRAFVELLLAELYQKESEPVLALEEPETHLHPQAARALWRQIDSLPGQKIVTTHSPYFVQHVPFRSLRLVRLMPAGTTVVSLPRVFSVAIPIATDLEALLRSRADKIQYDRATQILTVKGRVDEDLARDLMTCYGSHPESSSIAARIRDLQTRSTLFISDDDLAMLETFARRVRGEILFARKWLIVEGQAEYLIVHPLARHLGYALDEHGIAVIDAVNNGNPALFAALARALQIPWTSILDGDAAGHRYVASVSARGFDDSTVKAKCRTFKSGTLEDELLAAGLEPEVREALGAFGHANANTMSADEVRATIKRDSGKLQLAAWIADRITTDGPFADRMPVALREVIASLRDLA